MLKAYKYCLLPTEEQKQTLASWFGSCRFVYNLGLETKISAWAAAKKTLTAFDLNKQLTELRKTEQGRWLAQAPQQSLESALANMCKAYTRFFNGGGFPKFKKRSSRQSIQFRQRSKIIGNKIFLTKIGGIDFIQHRPIAEGEIRTVTVSKTTANKYFVSVLIETGYNYPIKNNKENGSTIGIDVGLKTFAVLSDGRKFENPKYLHKQLQRLKKEQRTLVRRYNKGVKTENQSNGWHKQRLIIAKLYSKIANQRKDFLHKASTEIVKNHDNIWIEDLNIKGMMKNGKLAKSVSDAGWSEFSRMLIYKADWYGKNLNYIDRFFPSSKTCSTCGNIFKELKLSDRQWDCEKCGTHHDRDENAANNIKNFGMNAHPSAANEVQKNERIGCKNGGIH